MGTIKLQHGADALREDHGGGSETQRHQAECVGRDAQRPGLRVPDAGNDVLLLEVAVDWGHMSLDEDFLVQSPMFNTPGATFKERCKSANVWLRTQDQDEHIALASSSPKALGNVRHRGEISPSQIVRAARVPRGHVTQIVLREGFDPFVTIKNYGIMGG